MRCKLKVISFMNSLFFVGSRMANLSVAYQMLISTCRMNGLSTLKYLKKFFRELVNGNRYYENQLLMRVGINTNNIKNSSNF